MASVKIATEDDPKFQRHVAPFQGPLDDDGTLNKFIHVFL